MRLNSVQLIKFCGTLTVSSPGTESIGLRANARVSWFLLFHLDSFIVTRQLSSIYRDLVQSRQIIVTRDFRPSTRTGKNHATVTWTATHQTAGPLAFMTSLFRDNLLISRQIHNIIACTNANGKGKFPLTIEDSKIPCIVRINYYSILLTKIDCSVMTFWSSFLKNLT